MPSEHMRNFDADMCKIFDAENTTNHPNGTNISPFPIPLDRTPARNIVPLMRPLFGIDITNNVLSMRLYAIKNLI